MPLSQKDAKFFFSGAFGAFTLGLAVLICPLEVHLGGERFQKNSPPKLGVFEVFGISKKTFFPVGLEGYNFNPK